jgi:hypothetical protein
MTQRWGVFRRTGFRLLVFDVKEKSKSAGFSLRYLLLLDLRQ